MEVLAEKIFGIPYETTFHGSEQNKLSSIRKYTSPTLINLEFMVPFINMQALSP